ncbi:MAG: methyltransferase domain-containing protein [Treponema sp.]|jgi:SAM-dependent methyltransferase/spore coat polysaccharide biosynthesis predicted glycosyltransferase SpsG|nr:methyltransferase domain-containing protein [Treponema sp.]
MSNGSVLIVPACERSRGGGHLSRSLLLLWNLVDRNRDAYLWIPVHLKDDFLLRFSEFFESFESPRFLSLEEELWSRNWELMVLDRFKTSGNEFVFWNELSKRGCTPLIGIDEGGPCRRSFDFLIDLLPGPKRGSGAEPNFSAPWLLPLPFNRRPITTEESVSLNNTTIRVLISFGAEDEAELGLAAARVLSHQTADQKVTYPLDITLIAPIPPHDSSWKIEELTGVRVMRKIPNLREQLSEYDLFISHFGLGAFEAVYARLPVLIISPTAYHEKLSRNAGFFSLGIGSLEKFKIDRVFINALNIRGEEIARRFGLEEDQQEDLGTFINGLVPRSPKNCPVCKRNAGTVRVLTRFPDESYRHCQCGTIYLARLNLPPIEYKKEYFFDLYKKQYGKTYLEDFPSLLETGRRRMAQILSLIPSPQSPVPSLLDIGCAYGPFLAAAAEAGFAPFGMDPVEDAVRYVKDELGFTAWHGFFPAALPDELHQAKADTFDVITLWFVIEHFEEPGKELIEINRLLNDGGVVAFSTPSSSGISGRKHLRSFLKNSPPDHWTVWSHRSCRKIFKQYGFRLRKIVVTGHHPERFPLMGRFVDPSNNSPLYRLLLFVSRLFRLGDTFEAYGVKSRRL